VHSSRGEIGRFVASRYQQNKSHEDFRNYHQHGAYCHSMSEHDEEMLQCVRKFNLHDLYLKGAEKSTRKEILPYFRDVRVHSGQD
jgi:Myo-inositol oxygenase